MSTCLLILDFTTDKLKNVMFAVAYRYFGGFAVVRKSFVFDQRNQQSRTGNIQGSQVAAPHLPQGTKTAPALRIHQLGFTPTLRVF